MGAKALCSLIQEFLRNQVTVAMEVEKMTDTTNLADYHGEGCE